MILGNIDEREHKTGKKRKSVQGVEKSRLLTIGTWAQYIWGFLKMGHVSAFWHHEMRTLEYLSSNSNSNS